MAVQEFVIREERMRELFGHHTVANLDRMIEALRKMVAQKRGAERAKAMSKSTASRSFRLFAG